MNNIGIYKIISPSGKIYIGQSINIEKRFKSYSKKGQCNTQIKLNNSFLKYGSVNHIFEILELCDIENLNNRERYWQDYYNSICPYKGLNCRLTTSKDKSGFISNETRFKMSKVHKGKKMSEESKLKMIESRTKVVLEITTGVFYTIKELSELLKIKSQTLRNKLSGCNKNKTNYRYV
jgi:group I intron endonuclease